jgi:acyl carrier protein
MQVKEQLRSFMIENFLFGRPLELTDDDSLQDAGIIDSTGVLELVTWLETQFGVVVGDDELLPENLDSINRLSRFLQSKLRVAAPVPALGGMEPQLA